MFPHFGKMLPNMFPDMRDDVLRRSLRQACWGTLICYRVQYAGTCVPRYTFYHFFFCLVCAFITRLFVQLLSCLVHLGWPPFS